MKKIIVLASGGIDSCVLIHVLARKGYEVHPVYIRQGLIWEKAEIFWLRKFLKAYEKKFYKSRLAPLSISDFPTNDLYRRHWSVTGKKVPGYRSRDERVYLPARNVILISKAALLGSVRKIYEIALGPLAGNPFPDSRREFFNSMEKTLSLGLKHRFNIVTPFLNLTKKKVLALAGDIPLDLTFSCLKPKSGHKSCGNCNKCHEREVCFRG